MSRFAKVPKAVSTPTIQAKAHALANKIIASSTASIDLKLLADELNLSANSYASAIAAFNDSISNTQTLANNVNNDYKYMSSIYAQLKATAVKLNKIGVIDSADLNDYLSVIH